MIETTLIRRIPLALFFLVVILAAAPVAALAQYDIPTQTASPVAFHITGWESDPADLQRGSEFEMEITFEHIGSITVNDVIVSFADNNPALVGLESSAMIAEISPGDVNTVSLRGGVTSSLSAGFYTVPLSFSYKLGTPGATRQSVAASLGIPVGITGADAATPRLIIRDVTSTPGTLTPGVEFTLTLQLENVGQGTAHHVQVRLGQTASSDAGSSAAAAYGAYGAGGTSTFGASTLSTIVPSGMSNAAYAESIDGRTMAAIDFDLAISGGASAGLFPLDVALTYEDAFGESFTDNLVISLRIDQELYLDIGLFDEVPDPIYVGDIFDLPIEIINIGRTFVNISNIAITSDDLTITNGALYLGPLDGGTSSTIIAEAEALEAGEADVLITIHYLDSFQQPQTITETLTFTIDEYDDQEDGESGGSSGSRPPAGEEPVELGFFRRVWRGILGFLGLGTQPVEGMEEAMSLRDVRRGMRASRQANRDE